MSLTPIYPADGFEAVEDAAGARLAAGDRRDLCYRGPGQRATAGSQQIVDEAVAQFVNYVPWQGRTDGHALRDLLVAGAPRSPAPGRGASRDTSTSRSTCSPATRTTIRLPPRPASILAAGAGYTPSWTYIASGGSLGGPFGLGALHVMLDRT